MSNVIPQNHQELIEKTKELFSQSPLSESWSITTVGFGHPLPYGYLEISGTIVVLLHPKGNKQKALSGISDLK